MYFSSSKKTSQLNRKHNLIKVIYHVLQQIVKL